MTTWERHVRGSSQWVTAECPVCKNGITIDLGEVRQKVADVIFSHGDRPCPPEAYAGIVDQRAIRFRHCRIEEAIPEKILTGEQVAVVEKPLAAGKVQFV
jgi:hypothetical protein